MLEGKNRYERNLQKPVRDASIEQAGEHSCEENRRDRHDACCEREWIWATGFPESGNRPANSYCRPDGTLRIQLNGAVKDWLLGANVAPAGATATVQVFEIDRDYKNAASKDGGQGFAKSLSYPPVIVMSNTVQVNDVGSRDTTTVYVEAPAWTTILITGPKDEVLYQTPLRKTLLVSSGVEFDGSTTRHFKLVLPPSGRTHEARLRIRGGPARSILQAKQQY